MSVQVIGIGAPPAAIGIARVETAGKRDGTRRRHALIAAATLIVAFGAATAFVSPAETGWQCGTSAVATAHCPAPSPAPAPTWRR